VTAGVIPKYDLNLQCRFLRDLIRHKRAIGNSGNGNWKWKQSNLDVHVQ